MNSNHSKYFLTICVLGLVVGQAAAEPAHHDIGRKGMPQIHSADLTAYIHTVEQRLGIHRNQAAQVDDLFFCVMGPIAEHTDIG